MTARGAIGKPSIMVIIIFIFHVFRSFSHALFLAQAKEKKEAGNHPFRSFHVLFSAQTKKKRGAGKPSIIIIIITLTFHALRLFYLTQIVRLRQKEDWTDRAGKSSIIHAFR